MYRGRNIHVIAATGDEQTERMHRENADVRII